MKKFLRLCLSIILSLFLISYFLKYIEIRDVVAILKGADIKLLLISFAIYFAFSVLRSVRIKILTNEKLMLKQIMPILLTYNLLNFIIPFRLGELTYIFLMKRTRKVSNTLAFASLAYIRALDIVFLFFLFGLSMLFIRNVSGTILQYKTLGIFFVMIILMISFGLLYFSSIARNILNKLQNTLGHRFYVRRWIGYVLRTLYIINSYRSNRIFILSNFLTLFIWLLIFLFYYLLAMSIGTSLSFFDFSLCVLLINLTGLLPIQGVAGCGTFEGAVMVGVSSFGVLLSDALSFSLSLHILYIIHFISFGLIGLLFKHSPEALDTSRIGKDISSKNDT